MCHSFSFWYLYQLQDPSSPSSPASIQVLKRVDYDIQRFNGSFLFFCRKNGSHRRMRRSSSTCCNFLGNILTSVICVAFRLCTAIHLELSSWHTHSHTHTRTHTHTHTHTYTHTHTRTHTHTHTHLVFSTFLHPYNCIQYSLGNRSHQGTFPSAISTNQTIAPTPTHGHIRTT